MMRLSGGFVDSELQRPLGQMRFLLGADAKFPRPRLCYRESALAGLCACVCLPLVPPRSNVHNIWVSRGEGGGGPIPSAER